MKKITKILLTVSVSILIVSFSKVVTSDSSEIENKAQKKIDERSKIPEELIQGNWDF